ncbi:hypothetical protein ATE80_11315 [Streptomyces kanasensis]|uniref:Uncharacterized protein n=1 Tax=Streptomyces kanasensis TaxID=936756 RepID=A0A117IWC5_9ACTN|nr:hypothetical protein ATE80_11315 [Streptomyces kanasensis]
MAQRGAQDTGRSRPAVPRPPGWTVTADVGEDVDLDDDAETHRRLPRPARLCPGAGGPPGRSRRERPPRVRS